MRIRASLTAVLATALLFPATVHAHRGCHTAKCAERVARKQCSQTRVVPCIRRAALHWRQPFTDALRVARCESTLNPYAVGFGIHHGLYQFLESTWQTTRYRLRWVYSAKWNALAAMSMWAAGRRGEWECQ